MPTSSWAITRRTSSPFSHFFQPPVFPLFNAFQASAEDAAAKGSLPPLFDNLSVLHGSNARLLFKCARKRGRIHISNAFRYLIDLVCRIAKQLFGFIDADLCQIIDKILACFAF